jgi:hypothetical protein
MINLNSLDNLKNIFSNSNEDNINDQKNTLQCSQCGKGYSKHSRLLIHERTHVNK